MWPKEYHDYPIDTPLKKEQLNSGRGICEMHELNGWGDTIHKPSPKRKGVLSKWFNFFRKARKEDQP